MHRLVSLASIVLLTSSAAAQQQNPPFQLPINVECKRDLVYGKGGGRDLKADLFLPKDGDKNRPAVVYVHGGGWQGGTKTAFQRQAAYLAGKGYVGHCIEYRLSGEAKFPGAVEDCKCAVRWLRANAMKYGVDPKRVAACGGSAGGHLVAMLGVTDKSHGLEGAGGSSDQPSRVNLVIAFNGVFDMETPGKDAAANANNSVVKFLGGAYAEKADLYRQASPLVYVDKSAAPFLFLHGTADKTVPIEQSRRMAKKLKDSGVKAEIYEAEGAGHGFFNRPPHYDPTLKRMEQFLQDNFQPRD